MNMQVISNEVIKMFELNDEQFNVVYKETNNIVSFLDAEYLFNETKQYISNNISLNQYQRIVSNFIALDVNQYLLK